MGIDGSLRASWAIRPPYTDDTFARGLLRGGVAHHALFGGTPAEMMTSLEAFAVYATLIPESGTIFNAGLDGDLLLSGSPLGRDSFVTSSGVTGGLFDPLPAPPVAVPAPTALSLTLLGVGLVSRARRRETSTRRPTKA